MDAKLPDHPMAMLLVARASRLILLPNSQVEKDKISQLITEQIQQIQQRNSSRGLKQRAMPSRQASRNRAVDNTVSYNCVLDGNTKEVKIPINCQTFAPFTQRLQRTFGLTAPNFDVFFL